ncbi:type II toxin-antitoxin system PemK/MazF family toxin [Stenotrophomonas sp. 57]|uniref:type II toxin-antitoxin system PemK/MazF family toxin n=1 Tax=Stenotrophomonas sp. 57 TaxID=3051119 RepID=UPI00256F4415|nr:type II toxin-antitoxin system PemK/MazF family toxin [Stenotrophomonas sp. 57]
MTTIVVEYVDEATGHLLGREEHADIHGVAVPRLNGKVTICCKSFTGHAATRWQVMSVDSHAATSPALVKVVLQRHNASVKNLAETTSKGGVKLATLMHPGKLVEVEYGHIPQVVGSDGSLANNTSFYDMHLKGEMHKRRLAVVLSVGNGTLQVAPVTSKQGAASDPTRVRISPETLASLPFYANSGLNSWALCGMVTSVAFARVLPPNHAGPRGQSRDHSYPARVSSAERREIMLGVSHSVGMRPEKPNKGEVKREKKLESKIALLEQQLQLVLEVARGWESAVNLSLDEEVEELRKLNAEQAASLNV